MVGEPSAGGKSGDSSSNSRDMIIYKYYIVNINYKYYIMKELRKRSNGSCVS